MIAATNVEYRFRYLIHTLIYTLGFSACWTKQWFPIGHNTVWVRIAMKMASTGMDVGVAFRGVLVFAIAFAAVGAWLRLWGAAYLGSSIVQQGAVDTSRVVADGPYRYLRNPLYLGTIFNTLALAVLMQPIAAIAVVVLITLFQFRLIAREEMYLHRELDPAYTQYCHHVPRLIPRLRTDLPRGGVQPHWLNGLLGEIYPLGTAVAFLGFGWKYDASLILQVILISLGLGLVAMAFSPKRG